MFRLQICITHICTYINTMSHLPLLCHHCFSRSNSEQRVTILGDADMGVSLHPLDDPPTYSVTAGVNSGSRGIRPFLLNIELLTTETRSAEIDYFFSSYPPVSSLDISADLILST